MRYLRPIRIQDDQAAGGERFQDRVDLGLVSIRVQEKLDRAPHPVGELVRPGQVHRPLPHHRVVKPLHELGEVHDRKCAGHLAAFLSLG